MSQQVPRAAPGQGESPNTQERTGHASGIPAQRSRLGQVLRRLFLAGLYGCTLFVCRWLAYQLRFDFNVPEEYQGQLWHHWHWVVAMQLGWLVVFGQFSGIYKYFSLPEIRRLAYAMAFSGISLYSLHYFDIGFSPPRGVILVECMTGFLALGGLRSAWRLVHERYFSRRNHRCHRERKVAIIGAGGAGADLVRELYARPNLGLVPVAFFDDARHKWGSKIHGIPVVGPPDYLPRMKEELGLEEAVIAMPSAPAKRIGEIVGLLQKARLKYVTVPGIDQLTSGVVRISQLRPVNIEDLLGRESIDLEFNEIGGVLKDRTVLVTGAGGSIGSELCRQVASFHPRRLLLVEQSEVQLFQIEQQLIKLGHGGVIVPVIADILDQPRMDAILRRHQPTVIFHAAAHKHVPMMEMQPGEAIKNNCLGTAGLAEMAVEHGVERFLMISTDKAVNPTSVMGASKRLAEVFLQSFARERPGRTKFIAVRFGNVLGSSGSVVPIFERQIAEGGPITVTHPDVVRFFMTIPEAVGLVLQSCAQGKGGEIFVLDMGKPVKIAELARLMIRLSGLEPDRDIETEFIGLRPGEKLCEELHQLQAHCTGTAHARIKRLTSEPVALRKVRAQLRWLNQELHTASPDQLKLMLREILPEYTPCLASNDNTAEAPVPAVRQRDLFADTPWAGSSFSGAPLAASLAGMSLVGAPAGQD
jgi:FlaA1/EpsC-like NDP-sugar epimerase